LFLYWPLFPVKYMGSFTFVSILAIIPSQVHG